MPQVIGTQASASLGSLLQPLLSMAPQSLEASPPNSVPCRFRKVPVTAPHFLPAAVTEQSGQHRDQAGHPHVCTSWTPKGPYMLCHLCTTPRPHRGSPGAVPPAQGPGRGHAQMCFKARLAALSLGYGLKTAVGLGFSSSRSYWGVSSAHPWTHKMTQQEPSQGLGRSYTYLPTR